MVDDQAEALAAAARVLEGAGLRVTRAGDGRGCLQRAHEDPPDLVLLDVNLPDMSGLEVCRRLKLDPRLGAALVVFWSAEQVTAEAIAAGTAAGGDGYIFRPVANAELVARLQGLLRHKETLDRLRESEARYRALFEGSPLPLWVLHRDDRRVLAANPAALVHYGYGPGDVGALTSADLFAEGEEAAFWEGDGSAPGAPVTARVFRQRRRDGSLVEAELVCHPLAWDGAPARVVFVTDLSERRELADFRFRERQALDAEVTDLEAMTRGAPPVTAQALGVAPLSAAAPGLFAEFCADYGACLDRALVERAYHAPRQVARALRDLAQRLFVVKAGPRDVTELHLEALRGRTRDATPEKAGGYLEVGRLTLLELMGDLVAAYRNHHIVRFPPPGGAPRPPRDP